MKIFRDLPQVFKIILGVIAVIVLGPIIFSIIFRIIGLILGLISFAVGLVILCALVYILSKIFAGALIIAAFLEFFKKEK